MTKINAVVSSCSKSNVDNDNEINNESASVDSIDLTPEKLREEHTSKTFEPSKNTDSLKRLFVLFPFASFW